MSQITKQQFDKLRNCTVTINGESRIRKFVRRGRVWVTVASYHKISGIVLVKYHCGNVYVDGKQLLYIPYYSFTNPKNPFKSV